MTRFHGLWIISLASVSYACGNTSSSGYQTYKDRQGLDANSNTSPNPSSSSPPPTNTVSVPKPSQPGGSQPSATPSPTTAPATTLTTCQQESLASFKSSGVATIVDNSCAPCHASQQGMKLTKGATEANYKALAGFNGLADYMASSHSPPQTTVLPAATLKTWLDVEAKCKTAALKKALNLEGSGEEESFN